MNPDQNANWQIQHHFASSTINQSTHALTNPGTNYAWNIFHQSQIYDAIPGIYESGGVQGFNPGWG